MEMLKQSFSRLRLNRLTVTATTILLILCLISCSDDDEATPSIVSISPEFGKAGDEVLINGRNLNQVTEVHFNTVNAPMKTKANDMIVVDIPEGATTGKISLLYPGGVVESEEDFAVEIEPVVVSVSDFEEADAETRWGKAEDAGEIQTSAITAEGDGHFFRLKGSDANLNYWVGGRYTGTSGSSDPLGITETDPEKVYFNVDIRSNAAVSNANPHLAKLVFEVFDAAAANQTKNWEIDFNVTWTTWKTISVRADKFHRWNGNGFDPFSGDITTAWVVALYLTGGSSTVYDFSFDNVRFSEGAPLGEVINP
ncbi:MAG TPA: IPT/TIG domain-containing protein [Chryseosolibacter sp.]|nr:IPT/TIG domain-containing protein [Chryseosolibacter sp.]